MLIKINGTPLSPIVEATKDGINIEYDVSEMLHDAYDLVHTPINVDLTYHGHNIISGDLNSFNWASAALSKAYDGIDILMNSLF